MTVQNEYKNNHYVPEWYQKRFILPAQKDNELYYLNLNQGEFKDPRGITHPKRPVYRQGFGHCFIEVAKTLPKKIYALDDQSALKVVDGKVEVISEGKYLEFN